MTDRGAKRFIALCGSMRRLIDDLDQSEDSRHRIRVCGELMASATALRRLTREPNRQRSRLRG